MKKQKCKKCFHYIKKEFTDGFVDWVDKVCEITSKLKHAREKKTCKYYMEKQ